MKVKLFWKMNPVKIRGFGAIFDAKAIAWEHEINAWLQDHPHIKITNITQSATGGSFGPMLWSISIWYEEGDS